MWAYTCLHFAKCIICLIVIVSQLAILKKSIYDFLIERSFQWIMRTEAFHAQNTDAKTRAKLEIQAHFTTFG